MPRRFREVEVELLDGDERTLRRLEKELRKAGARLDRRASAQALPRARPRGCRSRRGRARRGRRRARRSGSRSRREYRALLAHDPGTRRGDDPEDLHQLRVATRRLRAFLRAARPLVDQRLGRVAPRGARLARRPSRAGARPRRHARAAPGRGRALGDGRRGRGRPARGARGRARRRIPRRRRDARRRPVLRVARPARGRWLAAVDGRRRARSRRSSSARRSGCGGRSRPRRRLRRTRRSTHRGSRSSGPATPPTSRRTSSARTGARFVSVAKQLQDILGDHQDAVVAQARIRDWAAVTARAEAGLAAGRLVQLERDRMAAARRDWPEAVAQARPTRARRAVR